ncbi:hypothetical protein [Alteriqipengyuania sp. 357]
MFSRFLPALALAALVTGCSGGDPVEMPDSEGADPPGAAEALSLGGRLDVEGQSEFTGNVNCAVAIDTMVDALRGISGGETTPEVRSLVAARKVFVERAEASRGGEGPSVEAAMAQRSKAPDIGRSDHARLAIACIRAMADQQP